MKKTAVAIFLIICFILPCFSAVAEKADYTSLLLERGIISGDEKGLRENDSVLRCEFVKMVNRAFNIPKSVAEHKFSDVHKMDWFYEDFASAVENGYVKGDEKGKMNPYGLISRQEAITMIGRLIGSYNQGETPFKDNDSIELWAKGSVLALTEAKIIAGNTDNTFNPSGNLTRYESFVILTRLLEVDNNSPIEISSPFRLYLFNLYPNNSFFLSDNLELSEKNIPLPLCKDGFGGKLDGKGFKISGIHTEYNDYVLFESIEKNAWVSNLTIVCPEHFASLTKTNHGTIENCGHNSFTAEQKQYQSGDVFGSFAHINNGIIRSCYTSSYLKVRNNGHIGGICGINNGTVSDCFTTSNGSENAFGLVVTNHSILKNSFTSGDLVACKENTGSISYVSFIEGESTIGTQNHINDLKNIYNSEPFIADKNYIFPILKNVPYSKGDNFGEFGGGSGTKDDPFLVSSPKHLANVANYPEAFFLQKNDIDMSSCFDFTPIGSKTAPFSGEYNGNGFKIKNLTIVNPDINEPALFGTNTGKITNVHLKNGYIKSNASASSVIYRNHGICSFVTSSALVDAPTGGGIVCYAEDTSFVEKSLFTGKVVSENGGGIVGTNKGTIINCAYTGNVNATKGGGICYSNHNILEKNFSAGLVTANNADDICTVNTGTVKDCYYTNLSHITDAVMRQPQQLSYKESFPGLDFSGTWQIYSIPLPTGTGKYIYESKENTTDFVGGDGSISNPYKIATPVNFININKYPNACFILINDLDFSVVTDKTPVNTFSGNLNGNGKKITGISKESAIFEVNNGTVEDINSEGNICRTNNGIILNCHVKASLSGENLGGICTTNAGLVEICSFDGEIFASIKGGGISATNSGIIKNCSVYGKVTGKDENSSIFGISENENGTIKFSIVVADLYFTEDFGTFAPVSTSYTDCRYLDRYNEKLSGKLNFAELVNPSSYSNFDFDNIWTFNSLNIPVLKGITDVSYQLNSFKSGDGSEKNPFAVSSVWDLYNIRMYPKSHFVLTSDINLIGELNKSSIINNASNGFTPLPDFFGSIDGNGHSILGLNILYQDKENSGFTEKLYGSIKNINFIDCRIEGQNNTGIVCGINFSSISSVSVVNSRIGSKNENAGAIAGLNKGDITSCINRSDVFASTNTGGIAGTNEKNITSCANYGGVLTDSNETSAFSGGISGKNTGLIKTSMNIGKIISYSDSNTAQSGGITGENDGDIVNCYNTGTISSKGTTKSYSGGISGICHENSYITNVYNVAYCTSESPSPLTGALIGSAKGRIFNSYYDNTLTEGFGENNLTKNESTALSPDRMSDINCYDNFNTTTVWTMDNNFNYPQLIENPHVIYPAVENIRDFAGGDGSLENPYIIFTPQQLDNVRKYLGAAYILMGDLNMSQYCNLNGFNPIGDNIFGFFGTFIGNNNAIIGIKQSDNYYGGLFSRNNGEIYNLITEDFEINANVSGNLAAINTGLIYKCINTSHISAEGDTVFTGGIVGLNKSPGMIIYSSNAGTVTASGESSQSGGICYGNYGIIAGSFNSGDYVFSEGSKLSMAGGITSFNYGTISDCYSNADIYSNDISAGISATNSGNLINCYTTASKVFGKTFGGICALDQNSFISGCYYPIDHIDQGVSTGNSSGIIGVNSEELLLQNTFEDFDFENMWVMIDGYCPLILEAIIE